MADLPELAEWVDGIYQIEQTDPVLGGAPNETTGAGLTNIPALQLAKRTRWLKQMMENAGVSVEFVSLINNLNQVTQGGLYAVSGAAVGAPDPSAGSVVLHLPSNSGNAAVQVAFRLGNANRCWMRRKQSGAWAPWVEIMTGSNVQSSAVDTTTGRLLTVGAFGLGATASPILTNIDDDALVTGWYRTRPEDTISGTFPENLTGSGRSGVLQVMRLDGGSVFQTWRHIFSDRVWERRYTLNAWNPWRRVWDGGAPDFTTGANGYQRLPSGLIIQWGNGSVTDGSGPITFPIAFPTACRSIVLGDYATSAEPGYSHIVSWSDATPTGFLAVVSGHSGFLASSNFNYIAIGV